MRPWHPDCRCDVCEEHGPGACTPGSTKCPQAREPSLAPIPVETAHDDIKLARWLASGTVIWTRELCDQLRGLVKRNELIGSPLGREGYIVMRDLWWKVESMLIAQEHAQWEVGSNV